MFKLFYLVLPEKKILPSTLMRKSPMQVHPKLQIFMIYCTCSNAEIISLSNLNKYRQANNDIGLFYQAESHYVMSIIFNSYADKRENVKVE
jgi:hypothetical protein